MEYSRKMQIYQRPATAGVFMPVSCHLHPNMCVMFHSHSAWQSNRVLLRQSFPRPVNMAQAQGIVTSKIKGTRENDSRSLRDWTKETENEEKKKKKQKICGTKWEWKKARILFITFIYSWASWRFLMFSSMFVLCRAHHRYLPFRLAQLVVRSFLYVLPFVRARILPLSTEWKEEANEPNSNEWRAKQKKMKKKKSWIKMRKIKATEKTTYILRCQWISATILSAAKLFATAAWCHSATRFRVVAGSDVGEWFSGTDTTVWNI